MKFEFEFDAEQGAVTPIEGVAMLFAFVEGEEDPVLLYGSAGEPNTVTVVGMYAVALDEAKAQFRGGEEYED